MRVALICASLAVLSGCATQLAYTPPNRTADEASRSALLKKPFDDTWAALIPRLSEQFFVINTIDKSSGLISLSYSGNPERYVDCGAGTFNGQPFPLVAASHNYASFGPLGQPLRSERTMQLDGRINLTLEKLPDGLVRAKVNVRYVLNRQVRHYQGLARIPVGADTSSIAFNSNSSAQFPPVGNGPAVTCQATGQMERELIALATGT